MNAVAAPTRPVVLLLSTAVIAWAVTVERMRGMDAGPGTDLGGLGWYLGIWVTMMAAMMLPTAAPAAVAVARRGLATVRFAGGYLAVWTGFGLVAYGFYRLATAFEPEWVAWDERGPYLAGGLIVAAGLYELTPLKRICLRHCRMPLPTGRALRSGLRHGLHCVGCSGGLMVVLFAVGVMSLFWMALVAAVIFAEKVLPRGFELSRVVALALIALGTWVVFSPSSVPALTEPSEMPSMRMES